MKTIDLGGLTCRLVGGDDREGAGKGPLVILLHGFGAPGDDLVPLYRGLDAPRGTRFLFPEAPLALPPQYGAGRAWWMIDVARFERAAMRGELRDLSREVPAGLPEARAKMRALLRDASAKLEPSKIVLGGFSQGAMLSCDVALHDDTRLAGLVLFSGTLVAEEEWAPRMASRKGLPVLQSHGREDPLLPFSSAERLRDMLVAAALDVRFIPFNGGHGIPPAAYDALGALLKQVLVETPGA